MPFPIIVIAIIFSVTCYSNGESTQDIMANETRIYHGNLARNTLPFYVALMVKYPKDDDFKLLCGASLVDDQHVITAGHCTSVMTCGFRGTKCEAWLAPMQLSNFEGERIPIKQMDDVFTHPRYKSNIYYSDVGIIKLARRVRLGSKYKSICLANFSDFSKKAVRLVGFGQYNCKGTSDRLREASGQTVENEKCKRISSPKSVCARLKNSNDEFAAADTVDSGSPLFTTFYQESTKKRIYALLGIASYGIKINSTIVNGKPVNSCPNREYPSVYALPAVHPIFFNQWSMAKVCED